MPLKALGGGPLDEIRALRIAYLDEGGISRDEPFVVVAGIVPDPDVHYHAIEDELERIRQKLPEHRRQTAIFHAKDIHHGTGQFPRSEWPDPAKRFELLEDVARIPRKLGLDILFAHSDKAKLRSFQEWEDTPSAVKNVDTFSHVITASLCALQLEAYMRDRGTGEVAYIVAENNDQAKRAISRIHSALRNPLALQVADGERFARYLPLKRVIDAPLWAHKHESAPLQVADVCAWAIKRALQDSKNHERLFEIVRPNLLTYDGPNFRPTRIQANPSSVASAGQSDQ